MTLNIEKIKTMITQDDNLTEREQEELVGLFSQENDTKLASIVGLFSEDQSWIKRVNDNYKAKKEAMEKNDKVAWAKIMQDEEYLLTKVENT